jgi:cellulose synthase/poly-beta-1,6-N-acetylglucosamine synthase-like glycosyltransferase
MKTISYAVTACNEHVELERLLDQLDKYIRPEDEIVLQLDTTATEEVARVAEKYNVGTKYEYHRVYATLNNDFAAFKNNLKNHCSRDYILFIDADEYLSNQLIEHIKFIIENNDVELYYIPRINTVEGLTQEHLTKWRWQVNENGWVGYPDYQTRLIKNKKDIRWENKVHERIVGYMSSAALPAGYDLIHPKDIKRQERQNALYDTLQR